MRAEVFCDSNVLLYAASNAPEDAAKRAAARRVLALPGVGFSVQVLQEFYVNATRKRALRLSEEEGEPNALWLRRLVRQVPRGSALS
jgi:predicted nucleic acid-binding protein